MSVWDALRKVLPGASRREIGLGRPTALASKLRTMVIALGFDEWTTLAAVGLAAGAALASWASVAFGERALREGLMPQLVAQPIQPNGKERMDFLIYNGGGGLARGCSYVFVAGDHYALGRV